MNDDPASPGAVILGWWGQNIGLRDSGAARALAARLRRNTDVEILCEAPVQELAPKLGLNSAGNARRLLRLVRVLAEFRDNSAESFAHRLGGSDPVLSPARFQRLLRADGDELTTALIRAARMLGPVETRRCNIARLGQDLLYWNDTTRMRWSFDYFHAPQPEAPQPIATETPA
ncbi:MAG: type I-E CRISPR-associated protein Cse2/CasB [Rubellimicrobium sp.]|nr:type I-E CRISPR-associated protein Cse2/CasB [Rubellimicrobium sp.]